MTLPFDCPRCHAPTRAVPCDRDESDRVLEQCVAGCSPLYGRQPVDALTREQVRDAVLVVQEMDRKGELDAP